MRASVARVVVVMVGVAASAMAGVMGGCKGGGRGDGQGDRETEARAAASPRRNPARELNAEQEGWPLPVWPGTTLVVPWSGPPGRIGDEIRVTGAGGAGMQARLWRVWVRSSGAAWSGPVSAWGAEPVDPEDEESVARARGAASGGLVDGAVSWLVLAIEAPAGFHEEEIVVDGRRVRVAPSPELLESAWVSPMPPYSNWGVLLDAAQADETSPMMRWRARLVRAGVPDDPTRPVGAFENPLLEALAVQEELRWRTGLSRLHAASPDLARHVRARLLPVVESPQAGVLLPLWTQSGDAGAQLKDILLDDRATAAALVTRVESWLRRQPEAVAWFEHAFAQDAPGATAGFVRAWAGNVSSGEALAWIEFRAGRPAGSPIPEPVLLAPGELRLLEAPVVIGEGASDRVTVEVHVGARVERSEVVIGSIAAEPPGVPLGPLVAAHDAGSVLGDEVVSVEGGACAALLRRVDPTGLSPGSLAARGRWTLLMECEPARDRGVGTITADFAHDGGVTRIEVREDGGLGVEAPSGLPVSGYPRLAPVAYDGRTWTAEVPVPDWCVGLDGKVRVSLLRRGEAGGVWSWPTRVLRMAPERGGRAVIDLGAWDDGSVR